MTIRDRLLTGAVWIVAARIVRNLLSVLGMLVLARLLLPSDFGLVALGTTFYSVIWMLTAVPIGEALVQHPNPTDEHLNTSFTIGALRALLMALILVASAWPLVRLYHDHRVMNVMFALGASTAAAGFGNPRSIMLLKHLVFWQQFMLQAVNSVTTLVLSVGVAMVYHSYWALMIGGIAGTLVNNALSYTVLPFRPRLTLVHARELMSFSIWLTLAEIVAAFNWRLDEFLIGLMLGKAPLGYFVLGNNLASIPTREATSPLNDTLFPALSIHGQDRDRLRSAYGAAQSLVTAIALPLGFGFALIAGPFVRLALGSHWLELIFIIQALAAAIALQTIGTLANMVAMATGQTSLLVWRNLQYFALHMPLTIAGIWLYGLTGAVYARVLSGILGMYFNTSIVTKLTGLTFFQQVLANYRALLSVAAMVAIVSALEWPAPTSFSAVTNLFEIAVMVVAGGVVYVGCSALLWLQAGRPAGPESEVIAMLAKLARLVDRRPPKRLEEA
jgi:PST family polysaccharide transporter